ncbi:sodium:solute symporter family protein [Vibrio mimicus]|uniref:sodium:solute symporter family protein n=1 Tax=Vibrio mimicus TaxID=674 RepID=UPI0002B9D136|nr:sodium:solute symporter family protein [Vibrio mimicus]EMB50239.1 sodium:solute symporter family protein [Vibrio mimicus CAIM 602]MBY7675157.1 cation acetate symporter [Vibrio mimicus]MBY7727165.1 cation acetate symporter [Vibrio mimicus]TXY32645.1 cation acetate symporter [Vibrio mimicus]SUP13624.1 sodium:solute symporter family protein [Vibrio mimicus]
MDIQTWTFILVGITFALYIGIAIWARAGSTSEFYVAGGGVHPVANGMATAADWMSAASFISMAGIISFIGYDGTVYLMGWTGGYVLLALCLAPYLRKFGKFTVPDFIGDRYYSRTARMVAVFCAIFVSFTYVAGQMRGVGVVFARFLEVDINVGIVIGMAIVFFYAVMGGMKGITYTQVAQYCVLIFAFLVPAIFTSLMMTGNPVPQIGFGSTLSGTDQYLLTKLDGLTQELGFTAYTDGSKSMVDVFFICAALMVGTAGLPHVIIRFFTVPKVSDARISAGWALVFIAFLYTTAPAVAAFARVNMIDTLNGHDMKGVPAAEAPTWFHNWESTGLVKWEDKNGDGRLFYSGDARNEMTINNDIIVLASPEIAKLPNWVVALLAAGGLAAALSTAAGLLLVISTAISHDLLKKGFKPNMTDKQELLAARIAAALAIVGAGYLGINPPGFVAQVVAFAFGLAASSFFPAIILGIFYKKMNKEGAISGMLAGILFTAAYIIYFKFVNPTASVPANWWFGISPEGIGTLGMCLNFVVAIVVNKFTAEVPSDVQEMVESIRYPKGAGAAHDH